MKNNRKGRSLEKLSVQPLKLNGLINYQDGSVVSREIISRKTGTVTLFAFDEGQGLSEHTAPFDAVIHAIDGEAEVGVARKTSHLKEGELIVIPAKIPHTLKAITRFKMLLVMIRS
jgi:quercetin dioxygenase-like cupin family protein